MATKKLYDLDAYQTSFEATVLSCTEGKRGFEILLDQTCFFPEEGGQTSDIGVLYDEKEQSIQVLDVRINKENEVTHICDKPIACGEKVKGEIKWDKRFSDMQQHSGEHIISGLIYQKYGFHNVGFHLSKKEVTLDFDGVLSEEQCKEIEVLANQAIYQNFQVICEYPDKETLDKLSYRSKKALEGPIRIVTFPGYDICACCAPHVARTGEIGIIKIVHVMSYKGGVRINILCGRRALLDFQEKQDSVLAISNLLSAKVAEVFPAVQKLLEDQGKLKGQIAGMEREKIATIAENADKTLNNICIVLESLSPNATRELANLLSKERSGYCGVFVGNEVDGYRYIVTIADGDARVMQEKLKEICQVRGGGNKDMVQGSLTGDIRAIEECFK